MKTLSIDIETYSDIPLQKTGVYRYCESPNFEILLFGYSIDPGPVQVVDLACGEHIPKEVLAALEDAITNCIGAHEQAAILFGIHTADALREVAAGVVA